MALFNLVFEWLLKRFVKRPSAKHMPLSFTVKLSQDFPHIFTAVENPLQFSENAILIWWLLVSPLGFVLVRFCFLAS